MYCIFAKSTGKVLGLESTWRKEPITFLTRKKAEAYLNERYTEAGMKLWTIEKGRS